jgi:orotate phosphoribosyltransferase
MARFNTFYMDDALFHLPQVLERAGRELKDVDFDTLVGTGFSGSIVIPALALRMGKKFALVRKETDDSHHGKGLLVGEIGDQWIFMDDFVSSGRTRLRVIKKVEEFLALAEEEAVLVGQYMYMKRHQPFEAPQPSWGRAWWEEDD